MITHERLKEVLHYDPETGHFTWLVTKRNMVSGNIAGYVNTIDGYVKIGIDGKEYRAHRLAFLYMEGCFPEHGMDHTKGIRSDNRWSKIKHSTHSCNLQNQKVRSTNKSGFPGVFFNKKNQKWTSQAKLNGKGISFGLHLTALDAALARLTWETCCPRWSCNHRNELAKSIKAHWLEFNQKCLA